MKGKISAIILLLALLSTLLAPIAFAHNAPFPPGYDSTHFVIDTVGDPESMDPAWAYDSQSGEVIFNVYETLLFYDVVYEDGPYRAGKTNSFIPKLATALPTIDYSSTEINPLTGLPYYSTWYFPVRSGVQFHDGWGTLTPADVEYSFERGMIQDRAGGPQWLIFEPLLQEYYADPGPYGGIKINNAVKSNSTHVWFNLVAAYPELAFKQTLCQYYASVVSKAWAVSRGDFDGDWTRPWEEIYAMWHDPPVSPLDSPEPEMIGTGPYQFSYWNSGADYSLIRNPYYWNGWPGALPPERYYPPYLGGYIERVTWRELASWTVRRGNFLAGTSDETVVPRFARNQVLGSIVGGEKIRCYYPLPSLSLSALFFTLDITVTSRYMGTPLPPGTFGTNGIPPDIFNDINVRKGFAYAFDYNTYLLTAYLGEGEQPADPVIESIAYDNPNNYKYSYSLDMADAYLKLSWGGSWPAAAYSGTAASGTKTTLTDTSLVGGYQGDYVYFTGGNNMGEFRYITISTTGSITFEPELPATVAAGDLYDIRSPPTPGALWTGGMMFNVVYNIGNSEREQAAGVIAANVNSLNPAKFFMMPLGLSTYIPEMVASELPLFLWAIATPDYTDPHAFVFPFQHSLGQFPQAQRYSNPVVDALIQAGFATPDDTTLYTGVLDVAEPIPLMNAVGTTGQPYLPDWTTWPTNPNTYLSIPLDSRWPRRSIYYALQQIYVEETASVPLVQPTGRHYEQSWMRGWYYNPMYPGEYVYHRWKAKTHYGDVSGPINGIADGKVDGSDAGFLSAHWSNPAGVYGYHPTADINGGTGATMGGLYGLVKGTPDGKVNIIDLGLVMAYWDNPKGPSHP